MPRSRAPGWARRRTGDRAIGRPAAGNGRASAARLRALPSSPVAPYASPVITKFSTLYVGHIELERCGLSGTPADDRRYGNDRLAEVFDTSAALAAATDELGYETF